MIDGTEPIALIMKLLNKLELFGLLVSLNVVKYIKIKIFWGLIGAPVREVLGGVWQEPEAGSNGGQR